MPGLSYAHVPRTVPLVYTSLPDLLDEKSQSMPDKDAYVFRSGKNKTQRQSINFRDLSARTETFAAALRDFGVESGDRLAIFGRPCVDWLLVDLAVLRLKVILVRLPESVLTADILPDFLSKYRCRAIVIVGETQDGNIYNRMRASLPEAVSRSVPGAKLNSDEYPQYVISGIPESGMISFTDIIEHSKSGADGIRAVQEIQRTIDPESPSVILPTSGSTGVPKLTAHSQFGTVNILTNQSGDAVFFSDRPFAWGGSACYLPVVVGLTYVHADTTTLSGIHELFSILEEEKVNMAGLPLYYVQDAIAEFENGNLTKPARLSAISTGGEPTPPSVRGRLLRHVPVHIGIYGSTEGNATCVDVAMAPTYNADTADGSLKIKAGLEVKVTDEDGRLLPLGDTGMLWTRAATSFCGYLDNTDVSPNHANGWVNTGDLASLAPGGRLRIVARAVECISRGAMKVLPSTVTSVITSHDDVMEAYVIGVSDVRYGEEIGAAIVIKPGSHVTVGDIKTFCERKMDTGIALSIVPRYITIVEDLPKLASGKVDRLKVRDILVESN